jgi:hypothetical protein
VVVVCESGAIGCEIKNVSDCEQPNASVTSTQYKPADKLDKVSFDAEPLLQLIEYGEVPPVTVRIARPLLPPKHEAF